MNVPPPPSPSRDPAALLLDALVWIMSDGKRAHRLLDLTGLDPGQLRAAAGHSSTLVAVGRFLGDHEPDLVACADDLGVKPMQLITATTILSEGSLA